MTPQDKAVIVKPQFQPQRVGHAYFDRADFVIIGSGIAGLSDSGEQSLQHTLSLPSASAKSERGLWAYAGEALPRREYNDQRQCV